MIWCVEDDTAVREMEVYTLKTTGFDAEGFSSGKEMFEALQQRLPELILLDVMLPGSDGVTILRTLRSNSKTESIPVIMATAKGSEFNKVEALDLGADDYLVKPFGMMEMVSRVKAVMRRSIPKKDEDVIIMAGLELNYLEHKVFVNGEKVELTLKEFELLKLLISHPGIAYTRDVIFEKVWGMDFCGETRTVDVHIRTLRQKLGLPGAGDMIETVRGVGYRLEANNA